ncbi:hypothetical protein JL722_11090 [Aureococcus anophagefferens]|nr:hypothetical protein JL722_11090 [Aureococcus anophagefferens]
MVAAAALLALASLAGAAPTYVTIPPQRCGLQNVPHDPGRSTRIAVALFGLVRHNCTMANFERFLVAPLLAHRGHQYTMDVFLHANVVAKITNARTNEDHEVLPGSSTGRASRRAATRSRTRTCSTSSSRGCGGASSSTARTLRRQRRLDQEPAPRSTRSSSPRTSSRRELELQRRYHTVVSVRVDTIFTREVPGAIYEYVRRSPVAKLFIPHFGCSINGDLLMNDRFAMGQRDAMVDAYLTRVDTIANYSGATDGSRHGGLTGERHLLNTLQIHNVAVARMYEFCLRRVRARPHLAQAPALDDHQCPSSSSTTAARSACATSRAATSASAATSAASTASRASSTARTGATTRARTAPASTTSRSSASSPSQGRRPYTDFMYE